MCSSTNLDQLFQQKLNKRESRSAKRKLTVTPADSVDFSSNDFLSLSRSPILRTEFLKQLQTAKKIPLGSGGSRLLDGNSQYVEELEQDIADFHGAPAGLLFNSGFDANSALLSCVPQADDIVIYDEYIHASVHEGMRLSRAGGCYPFKHNCPNDLDNVLCEITERNPLILSGSKSVFVAVETVYSMDGDVAPLQDFVKVIESRLPEGNGHVVVDEAHSTGVYGDHGRGIVSELGLENKMLARLHTFGKALSSGGAVVLCSPIVREYLINYARSLIYTTALGLPTLAMIVSAYRLMRRGTTLQPQKTLWQLITYFHRSLLQLAISEDLHVSPDPPASPVFSLRTTKPRELASACQEEGLIVRPIVHPTVPRGAERVRICLHAGNTTNEVDRLLGVIKQWLQQPRLVGDDADIQPKPRL